MESNNIIQQIKTKKSSFWMKAKDQTAFKNFKVASERVPAYKDFLKDHKINARRIKTVGDLSVLPVIDKKNYLRKYSLSELTVDGSLQKPLVFTSTSGSTGDPFYFHRSFKLDWQASVVHELFYLNGHYKKNEPVLVIVCFGMGVWIGGLITYQAFDLMQGRGYEFSLITPGINKEEILKILKNLGHSYKNIILAGYPPFIKDVVDEALSRDIDLHKLHIRIIFAAEAFSESFRDYMVKALNIKNPLLDIMNIYGTADLGTMAFETPLSVLVRRLCVKNPKLFEAIFGKIPKTPTLCQYIPSFISFYAENGNLLVNSDNTMPLINYSLGDHGGVYSFEEISNKFSELGLDLRLEAKKFGIEEFCHELPFVYVYERDDFSTTIYGLQVYPEPIKEALLEKPLSSYLTGKFTMETEFDDKQNQYLLIHLEMKKSHGLEPIPQAIKTATVNTIVEQLEAKNSEYRELRKFIGKRALPRLQFYPAEDPKHFKIGIKQKWVKK